MQTIFISSHQIGSHPVSSPDVVMIMPFTDAQLASRASVLMTRRAGHDGLLVCVHDDSAAGFIQIANRVFRESSSPLVGYVAQDAFAGRQWLARAIRRMQQESAALLAFNDGKWAGQLAAFGLAERQWAAQNYAGDLFCPHYQRHYADVELTLLAQQAGRYSYEPDSVLVEVDWDKDSKAADTSDRARFLSRLQSRFDERVTDPRLLATFS